MLYLILIALINAARQLLGPATCLYTPSCTAYATQLLREKPLFEALWLIIKRVFSCNPINGLIRKINQHF